MVKKHINSPDHLISISLLMDIEMPVMNGVDAAKLIRKI
jgi:CheY-like chemotaxis protein